MAKRKGWCIFRGLNSWSCKKQTRQGLWCSCESSFSEVKLGLNKTTENEISCYTCHTDENFHGKNKAETFSSQNISIKYLSSSIMFYGRVFSCQDLPSLLQQGSQPYPKMGLHRLEEGPRAPWWNCMLTPDEKGIISRPRLNFQHLSIIFRKKYSHFLLKAFHFHMSTGRFAFTLDIWLKSSCIFQPF